MYLPVHPVTFGTPAPGLVPKVPIHQNSSDLSMRRGHLLDVGYGTGEGGQGPFKTYIRSES